MAQHCHSNKAGGVHEPNSVARAHRLIVRRRWRVVVSVVTTLTVVCGYALAGVLNLIDTPLTFSVAAPRNHMPFKHPTVISATPLSGPVDSQRPIDKDQAERLIDDFVHASGVDDNHFSIGIADGEGHIVASRQADLALEPASTMKTLTALAASSALDMGSTFTTATYLESSGERQRNSPILTIKGDGDMLLGPGVNDPDHINGRAGLASLADQTARALLSRGVNRVRLCYDDSLFGDERYPANISDNNPNHAQYTAVSSMAIDGGRQWGDLASHDPDTYTAYPELSPTPASDAANLFGELLAARGVTVESGPDQRSLPAGASPVSQVRSATLSEVLAFALRHSDNTLAELFGRLTALKSGTANSPEGAMKAVRSKLAHLGVDLSNTQMADCSGLSPGSRLTTNTLLDVQAHNVKAGQGVAAAEGLSVPGLVGTAMGFLDDPDVAGLLRVKTGSLEGVSTLAGNVSRKGSGVLTFAIMTNGVTDIDAVHKARDVFISGLAAL